MQVEVMWDDSIKKLAHEHQLSEAMMVSWVERMLEHRGLTQASISILCCDDERMRMLNHTYANKDETTDVLSFAMQEWEDDIQGLQDSGIDMEVLDTLKTHSEHQLGDIVLSLPRALEQARSRKLSIVQELQHLMAHGLLHLLGYDHQNEADTIEMTRRTHDLCALFL